MYIRRQKNRSSEARASKAKAKTEANLVLAKAKADPRAGVKALFPVIDAFHPLEKEKGKDDALKARGKVRAKASEWAKMVIQFAKDQIVQKIVTKDIIPTGM